MSRIRESLTLLIVDTESRQLPSSLVKKAADSAYLWYGESPAERFSVNSPHQRCGESSTTNVVDTKSRHLPTLRINYGGGAGGIEFETVRRLRELRITNNSVNSTQKSKRLEQLCKGPYAKPIHRKKYKKSVSLPCPLKKMDNHFYKIKLVKSSMISRITRFPT
jgi:hypothetical protein